MVLTDRQRAELHAGIHAYLLSRGEAFVKVAEALGEADPTVLEKKGDTGSSASVSTVPLLEKKWTAVPRLQKKVLELERTVAQAAKSGGSGYTAPGGFSTSRRMLPRAPCAHTLQGHSNTVSTVVVHPVFNVACSGSDDATIKVWDHESGEYIKTLKGHTGTVHCLTFTSSGSHLASSSSDLTIKIWDFKTYTCIRTLRGHDHTVSAVCFLPVPPSGLTSTTSTSTTSPSTTTVTSMGIDATAAGSAYLLSASRDKSVKVWELETGFCVNTVEDHNDWVRCLAVRPDGKMMASGSSDFNVHVYDLKNNPRFEQDLTTCLQELRGHEHVVEAVAFVCRAPQTTASEALNSSNGTTSSSVKLTTAAKKAAEADNYLVSGSRDRTVRLWNITTKECLSSFAVHENWVRSVLIHPSGNYIISAGDDRTIRVLDIKSNRCLRTIEDAHQHFVTSISMHHSLPILVSGGVDHTVKCWNLD